MSKSIKDKLFGKIEKTEEEVMEKTEFVPEVSEDGVVTTMEDDVPVAGGSVQTGKVLTDEERGCTEVALGIRFDPTNNKYNLVEIKYNPNTLEVGSKANLLQDTATDTQTINEAFKINVVRKGILRG